MRCAVAAGRTVTTADGYPSAVVTSPGPARPWPCGPGRAVVAVSRSEHVELALVDHHDVARLGHADRDEVAPAVLGRAGAVGRRAPFRGGPAAPGRRGREEGHHVLEVVGLHGHLLGRGGEFLARRRVLLGDLADLVHGV